MLEKHVKFYAKHNNIPEEVKPLDNRGYTGIVHTANWKVVSWKPRYEPETALGSSPHVQTLIANMNANLSAEIE